VLSPQAVQVASISYNIVRYGRSRIVIKEGALVFEYIPPRNAVNELIQRVPDELRQLLIETWKEHDKQSESWPDVPYHYGQGRIREYEVWRDSLSEQDQKQEIAAVRVRYEAYYDAMARSLVEVMAKQGHDISTYLIGRI
jgi:hypothetical protein